ncbi:MAG TPA: DUF6272 family protein [Flavobacteriales bacterium]
MEKSLTQYQGALSSEVRIQLTDLIQAVALANIGKRTNVKKLCAIAIELLDNAQRYCSNGNIRFEWQLQGDLLVVRIENQAAERDAQRMLESIQAVNRMGPEELVEAFRSQLTNGKFGEKGGAGLGFLDIARKSKGPISADIAPLPGGDYWCRSEVSTNLA